MHFQLYCLILLIAAHTFASASRVDDAPTPEKKATAGIADASLETLAADSSLWPFRVALKTDKLALEERHGVTGHVPGVLIRVEGNEVVLDFGREGIHRFPLAATDFRKRVLELRDGSAEKELPNFIRYTTNAFARIDRESKRANIPVDVMLDHEHFLIAYLDQRLLENEAVLAAYRKTISALEDKGLWTLMMPTDINLLVRAKDYDLPRIFPLPHLAGPMIEMLHHKPGDQPKFVLIDAEGKVLDSWEMAYGELPDRLPKVRAAVMRRIERERQ